MAGIGALLLFTGIHKKLNVSCQEFLFRMNRPYSRYQPSLRTPWCCRENITVTWSIKGQTAGFAKFELSSNVNKASLNPAIVNFQRFLKANFHFTMLFIYITFVQYFYEEMGKKDRCAVYGCDNNRRYPDR